MRIFNIRQPGLERHLLTAALAAFLAAGVVDARGTTRPLLVSGTPATSVLVGHAYSFLPHVTGPAGHMPMASISHRPSWAKFWASGRLFGTPTSANVGTYRNIVITVRNGISTVSLPPFSITVKRATPPPVPTISGTPPTHATVGSGYNFTPKVSGPVGYRLRFWVLHKPSWTGFNTADGRLSGTPTSSNEGTFSNIVIGVTDGVRNATLAPFSITVRPATPPPPVPTISGTPPTHATVGTRYSFTPVARDGIGDALSFSVRNLPAWATFSIATGTISGTPAPVSVGTDSNIVVSVSNGTSSASLAPFSINVAQPVTATIGTAALTWTAPTTNTDGSALTDLAGYHIYYGTSPSALSTVVDVANPGTVGYTVRNLTSGTWYFAVNAYTTSGLEGALSGTRSKSIP